MDEEQKKIQISRLLGLAYHYLSYRPRTKKEITDYLQKKSEKYSYSQDIVNTVSVQLEEEGLVNDESFIESFIYSRSQNKPKGKYALTAELLQKGIDLPLIESFLSKHPLEEESLAMKALQRIWVRISRLPRLERTKKATDFLRRRGFQYDVIKKTIEELEHSE